MCKNDGICTTETGSYLANKKKVYDQGDFTNLFSKLNVVEEGGYVCICDLYSVRYRYNICIMLEPNRPFSRALWFYVNDYCRPAAKVQQDEVLVLLISICLMVSCQQG